MSNMSEELVMAEETQIVNESEGSAPEVEVTLDGEEAKAVKEEVAVSDSNEDSNSTASSDDELDNYSKGVQKRIKKLTEKYRYAERDKEEASRLAQSLKEENDQLRSRLSNLDNAHLTEYGSRLESQTAQAKAAYQAAHERGDSEALFQSQEALAKLAIEKERYRLAKQQQEQVAPQQQVVAQEPTQEPVRKPNPKAEKWAESHEWFGEDEVMTAAAYAIDKQLISEGFDGTEDEYYTQLDTRLKKRFPNEMGGVENEGSQRVASASASASRSAKQGRRTVKLTPSQVAIAKKLGVPLDEYAKYVKD